MNILIIDQDPLSTQFIKSKLEPFGHKIQSETSKHEALRLCKDTQFDLIMLDPSPMTSPRNLVQDLRNAHHARAYKLLISSSIEATTEALLFGVNDFIAKPINPKELVDKLENAQFFSKLVKHIGDSKEDFPSANGIISRSAFNQLFLSSVDRADRYGEGTYLLCISLSNYTEIVSEDGQYTADYAAAKLSQFITQLRRQSDIVGQIAVNEFDLLLQRPVSPNEPIEAAERFIQALSSYKGFHELDTKNIEINVTLIEIPSGTHEINKTFRPIEMAPLG